MTRDEFNEMMDSALAARGWTIRDLANAIGRTDATIYTFRRAETNNYGLAVDICEALAMPDSCAAATYQWLRNQWAEWAEPEPAKPEA